MVNLNKPVVHGISDVTKSSPHPQGIYGGAEPLMILESLEDVKSYSPLKSLSSYSKCFFLLRGGATTAGLQNHPSKMSCVEKKDTILTLEITLRSSIWKVSRFPVTIAKRLSGLDAP